MAFESAWINGKIVPTADAKISIEDRGLLYGDGLFETLRVYDGVPLALDRHLARLFTSMTFLNLSIPESATEILTAVEALLVSNEMIDGIVRITVTRGSVDGPLGTVEPSAPTRLIQCRPLPHIKSFDKDEGVDVVIPEKPIVPAEPLYGHKTLNYLPFLLAKQAAREAGAFEAIVQNSAGDLIEGASANLFLVKDKRVLTPSLKSGALPGITRGFVLELLKEESIPVEESAIRELDLYDADEAFLTNSVIEIIPVARVNGRTIGEFAPGPITKILAKKYREQARSARPR
jgi:branched-chain amino acid aminotransferase